MKRQDKDLFVTLVHGTWARRSEWVQPGSHFRREIETRVPNLAHIDVFEWSGRNSARARAIAAWDLATRARESRERNPGARHYVIAHSHGGNVALGAFAHGQDLVDGIACLATPFIAFRQVSWEGDDDDSFVGAIALGGVFLTLFAVELLALAFTWALDLPRSAAILLTVMLFLTPLVVAFVYQFWGDFKGSTATDLAELNLLVIRSPGDEATAALAASHFLSWLAGRMYRFSTALFLGPAKFLKQIVYKIQPHLPEWVITITTVGTFLITLGFWQIGAGFAIASLLNSRGLSPPWFLSPTGLWEILLSRPIPMPESWTVIGLGVFVYLTLFGLILSVFALSLWLCGLPYGYWMPSIFPTYYVSAESTPPGAWQTHRLGEPHHSHATLQDRLAHSEPYSHPEAVTILVKWLNSRPLEKPT